MGSYMYMINFVSQGRKKTLLDSSYIELSIVLDCRVSIVTAARLVDIRIDGHCQCPPGRTQQTKTT